MNIKMSYRNDEIKELYKSAGIQTEDSAGFDLITAEDISFSKIGEFKLVDLGVIIKVPKDHHSLLMPRSSTFKKHQVLQANSVGLIDEDYCGAKDFWKMPLVYFGEGTKIIPKGTRLCQLVLQKTTKITEVEDFVPTDDSRGGFGSTGV
ncbi:MAG: deoxyuridine 5'-triphosphate nucleotidohydrolase [Candidatus Cloacimonadota bacterium]|nr:MAG: deoxyuridine 5'-triphosphate nucleotidohydrolase [Candidatus Cloacimonadota bacterium]